MAAKRNRLARAAKQNVELAMAVPQVIAHRTLRMAGAGLTPSARDQREFWTMGLEKALAFNQSWFAMWLEAGRINQQLALSLMRAFGVPWTASVRGWDAGRLQRAALDIAHKGMGPVHRRAVANAKRLGKVRGRRA